MTFKDLRKQLEETFIGARINITRDDDWCAKDFYLIRIFGESDSVALLVHKDLESDTFTLSESELKKGLKRYSKEKDENND